LRNQACDQEEGKNTQMSAGGLLEFFLEVRLEDVE